MFKLVEITQIKCIKSGSYMGCTGTGRDIIINTPLKLNVGNRIYCKIGNTDVNRFGYNIVACY